MTSKEFHRRLSQYGILDFAAKLFIDNCYPDFIYKIDMYFDTHMNTTFQIKPVLNFDYPINLSLLCFDRFDRSTFEIQFRYFEGFLNRLSKYQLDVLLSSGMVDNLLKYCKRNNFSNS